MGESFEARDWERFGSLLDEDAVFDDSRPIVRSSVQGREAIVDVGRSIADSGVLSAPLTVIATRGQRLMLGKTVLRGRDLGSTAYETEVLAIVGLNAQGLIDIWMPVDSQDMAAAFATLDDRYLASDGPSALERVGIEFVHAYNRREWDRFAEMTEAISYVDHSPVGSGTEEATDYVAGARAMLDLAPDQQLFWLGTLASYEHGGLALCRVEATAAHGGRVENQFLVCVAGDAERLTHLEIFPEDRRDVALARLDELASALSPLENECVRVLRAFLRTFEARDWEALAAHHREDFAMHDRRIGLGMTYRGRDTQVEVLKGTAEVGTTNAELTPIAVRGSRLSLVSTVWRGPTDTAFGSEFLAVSEIDEGGRIAEIVVFGSELVDEALVELDERYAAGEGAHAPQSLRLGSAFTRAHNTRDWAAFRTLLADDLVVKDHRPVGVGDVRGADEWVEGVHALVGLMDSYRMEIAAYARLSPSGALLQMHSHGTSGDGVAFENDFYCLSTIDHGRISLIEFLPTDQLDAAVARWAELNRGSEQTGDRLHNRATTLSHRHNVAFEARDWTTYEALLAEDVSFDDRRKGFGLTLAGRSAQMEVTRAVAEVAARFRQSTVAIRGELLTLDRMIATGQGGPAVLETEFLSVKEYDASGRLVAMINFDDDDLDSAMVELDARFIAGEGAPLAELVHLTSRVVKAVNERDWAGLSAVLADDLAFVDHRPASLAEGHGGDRRVAELSALLELLSSYHCRIAVFYRIEDPLVLGELAIDGRTADGSEVEISYLMLAEIHNEVCSAMEIFPIDRLDDALARFGALAKESGETNPPLENSAWRVLSRAIERMMAEDWDGVASLYAPDVEWEDTRPGLRSSTKGRDSVVEHMRVMGVGATSWDLGCVATRGDRLALARGRISVGTFQIDLFGLCEVDASGLITYSASYGSDDFAAAVNELDARFVAGEGSEHAATLGAPSRFVAALNDRGWDAMREVLSADFVFHDHRAASLGEIGSPEGWIESLQILNELASMVFIVRYHAIEQDRVLLELLSLVAPDEDRGDYETTFHALMELGDGRIERLDVFPIDALYDALALLDEPRPDSVAPSGVHENAASHAGERAMHHIVAADWDAFGAAHSEAVRLEDRRSGLRWEGNGREALLARAREHSSVYGRFITIGLATRGEKLTLARQQVLTSRDSGAWESERLVIFEIDDQGLITFIAFLDTTDLDEAFVELDERYLAGEGAPFAAVLDLAVRQREALARGDWANYRTVVDRDVTLVDHRPASLGTIRGIDDVITALQAMPVVSGLHPRAVAVHAIAPDRTLIETSASATSEHGTEVEMHHHRLQQVRNGKVVRMELFPIDELETAKARFEALGGSELRLANSCTRVLDLVFQASVRGDRGEARSLYADGYTYEDRRLGMRHEFGPADAREAAVGGLGFLEMGSLRARLEPIAIRGDRLALHRIDMELEGFEIEYLGVNGVDDDGRLVGAVIFDPEDLDSAFAELDERYMVGEESRFAEVWRAAKAMNGSYNARDWNAARRAFADDAILIDHRPVFLGELTPDQWVDSARVQVELAPNTQVFTPFIHYIDDGVVAFETHGKGTTTEGVEFDIGFIIVAAVGDGVIQRLEWFTADDLASALARVDELVSDRDREAAGGRIEAISQGREPVRAPVPENACVRAMSLWSRLYEAADWNRMLELHSDDFTFEDRRAGMTWAQVGASAHINQLRVMADIGTRTAEFTPIATRGDRLVLGSWIFGDRRSETVFETEGLVVNEIDSRGVHIGAVVFAPDKLDAAFAELDERFLASGTATDEERLALASCRFYNDRDWTSRASVISDDVVVVDHRLVSRGETRGPDGLLDNFQGLIGLVPDVHLVLRGILRWAPGILLASVWGYGPERLGNRVEFDCLFLYVIGDGKVCRLENFPPEQREAATARFEELESLDEPDSPLTLNNMCARVLRDQGDYVSRDAWDEAANLVADDAFVEDRRTGLTWRIEGRAEVVSHMRIVTQGTRIRTDILAVRGERLALLAQNVTSNDFEVESLFLVELSEAGLLWRGIAFDADDVDAAFRELDDLYLAGEGASWSESLRPYGLAQRAADGRDWDGLHGYLSEDFVFRDHRTASLGRLDRDDWVASMKTLVEVTPSWRTRTACFPRVERDRVLAILRNPATNAERGAVEFVMYFLAVIRDGLVSRVEIFPVGARRAAEARFDELGQI